MTNEEGRPGQQAQEPADATPTRAAGTGGGAPGAAPDAALDAALEAGSLPFPLQEDERVLGLSRRHWMYLWPRTLFWTLLALGPVVVLAWLLFGLGDVGGRAAQIFWVIAAVYVLFWGVRIALNWYRYRNDIWVITNQRIVDVIKPNPFSLKLSSADLVNIQDMTVNRTGILQTVLNYGDIHCQTAADNKDFVLNGVPNPQDLQLLIDRERDRDRMRTRGG